MVIRTAIVRFTDNQTGTSNEIPVAASGNPQSVAQLLSKTKVGQDGFITSIDLALDFENVELTAFADGTRVGQADGNANTCIELQRTPINELTVTLSVIPTVGTAEA